MTVRTLAEAAAEILNGSRSSAQKEPMHKLDNTGSGLDSVHDLGGVTLDDMEGGDVGKKAAAAAPSATPPGEKPAADSKASGGKLTSKENESGKNKVDLDDATDDSGNKKKELAKEETTVTDEELEAARQERWNEIREKMKNHSVQEDVDALFNGESLSEEFKTKATTIFEAAVLTRAIAVAEELEKDILAAAEEAIEETRAELEEQIDTYLNFVVEKWVADNEVAIESGLRSEVVEGFITGLKNLFAEHYVEVPADKVDVVAEQASRIEALEAEKNEILNNNIDLTKKLAESRKAEILKSVCEGLTATQAEKVKTLAEGVEFTTEGEYAKKVAIIKEGYVSGSKVKEDKTNVVALTEGAGPATVEEEKVVDPFMAAAVRALGKKS